MKNTFIEAAGIFDQDPNKNPDLVDLKVRLAKSLMVESHSQLVRFWQFGLEVDTNYRTKASNNQPYKLDL